MESRFFLPIKLNFLESKVYIYRLLAAEMAEDMTSPRFLIQGLYLGYVMVTRGNPDTKELQLSAQGICSNQEDDLVKRRLEIYFEPLAEAYKEICRKQKREFFGLRDFYR